MRIDTIVKETTFYNIFLGKNWKNYTVALYYYPESGLRASNLECFHECNDLLELYEGCEGIDIADEMRKEGVEISVDNVAKYLIEKYGETIVA